MREERTDVVFTVAGRRAALQQLVERTTAVYHISHMTWLRLTLALTGRAILHPGLGIDLLRVAWRFRHRHWYKRFPFLPLPAQSYMRWRMYTAYGDENAIPPAEDVIAFARWIGKQP